MPSSCMQLLSRLSQAIMHACTRSSPQAASDHHLITLPPSLLPHRLPFLCTQVSYAIMPLGKRLTSAMEIDDRLVCSKQASSTHTHMQQRCTPSHSLDTPSLPTHAQAVAVHERLEPTKSERLLEYLAVARAKLLLAGKRCSQ